MTEPVEKIIAALRAAGCEPKRSGNGYTSRCPAHDDRTPSLSIGVGADGRALVTCHAGCPLDSVLEHFGLRKRDLFPQRENKKTSHDSVWPSIDEAVESLARSRRATPIRWDYHNIDGEIVGGVLRWDRGNGKKDVLPLSPCVDGWRVAAMPYPRPLYRLPQIVGSERVIVCEGEKAADAVVLLGLEATTSPGGSKSAAKADWSVLSGRDVVILPDNDEPGEKYARDVAAELAALKPPARVRIVELPDLPRAGDVVEFIAARDDDLEIARSDLDALIDQTEPCSLENLLAVSSDGDSDAAEDWPEPVPLPSPLPSVAAFDPAILPAEFRAWIVDIAERMQCPMDFPAVAAMIAAAGVIGRKVGIRPKRRDDWLVVPNLWGILIGRPSMMKSPPLREVMRPVKQLIMAADANHAAVLSEHREEAQELMLRKAALESSVKAKLRKSGDAADELEELKEIASRLNAAPVPRRRYVVNDATVQALSEVLATNPNGVILVRDELIGFLKSLETESQQAARAFYLEAWDGNGSYESDRIGRGNTRVHAVCLSLVGTCQPGPLGEYLSQAVRGGVGDDGLMQRFQLAVWPDDPGPWVNIDRFPDSNARNRAFAVFDRLDRIDAKAIGAGSDTFDESSIPYLRFDEDAYQQFVDWMTERENRLRSGAESPAIESHLTKYRSLIPSIALVCHLVDGGTGAVPLPALEQAIAWGDYLESHARRIYAQGCEPGLPAATSLATRLVTEKLESGFTLRDVYRRGWSGLTTKEDVLTAVNVLIDLDWLRPESLPTGGAPKTVYHVNPKVLAPGFEALPSRNGEAAP
jgi:hypothetical protein